jgi:hypothetical protein
VLKELIEKKTNNIIPEEGNWQIFFTGFSRSGWTSSALVYENQIMEELPSDSNWDASGIRLVDLAQLDQDLQKWTA